MEEATASTRSLEQIPTFLHVHVVRGRISEAEFAFFSSPLKDTEAAKDSKNNSVQHNTTDIRPLSTTYIEPLSTTEYHLVPLGTTSTAQYHLVSPTTTCLRL